MYSSRCNAMSFFVLFETIVAIPFSDKYLNNKEVLISNFPVLNIAEYLM